MSQPGLGTTPDATASAKAAQAAADQAENFKISAEAAATKAEAAKVAAEAIRTKLARGKCYQNIQAGVAIITLFVLFFQGYKINEQSKTTAQQLRVASYTEELGIEQRLREGTQALQKLIYDKNGVFAQAREVSCSPMPEEADKPETEAAFKSIVSHYELYHKAAKRDLIPKARWRAICLNAKALFEQNCLLQTRLNEENSLDSDFRDAFIPKCALN
jgi:hypothetical protein